MHVVCGSEEVRYYYCCVFVRMNFYKFQNKKKSVSPQQC